MLKFETVGYDPCDISSWIRLSNDFSCTLVSLIGLYFSDLDLLPGWKVAVTCANCHCPGILAF